MIRKIPFSTIVAAYSLSVLLRLSSQRTSLAGNGK